MNEEESCAPSNRLLAELTDAQREAATHFEGPLLILAGPGSGKTRVVTHRVAWLLSQGVPGRHILALTFTNKAADEMSRRIERLAADPTVWVGTFHRFCARLLRKYAPLVGLRENYTIYDTGDSVRALRQAIGRTNADCDRFTPETIAKAVSWAKNHLISSEDYRPGRKGDRSNLCEAPGTDRRLVEPFRQIEPVPFSLLGDVVREVYPLYQRQLAASNAADFDDLLFHVATILRENPEIRAGLDQRYRFILLDEYQDTNLAQYAIARALSVDYPNLAVTGDPDQSIYGWRGASLGNILEFERDFPDVHVVRLERNYRSTQRILRVAGELIAHNVHRKEKELFTENGPGAPVRLTTYATQKDEAEGIAGRIAAEIRGGRRRPRDFAVFYRVNALSRAMEFALRDLGVPYQMVNGLEFFQRKEIKDVLAYLHLLNNPQDEIALLRVVNVPPRGIGKTTVGRLTAHAMSHGLPLMEAARRAEQVPSIGPRAARVLGQFVALLDRLSAAIGGPIEELLGLVLSETGYHQQLRESDDEEDQQRLANIEELLTVARDFDERRGAAAQLEAFLEETCLVNDTDAWEVDVDRVTLMTLHASKGLEFPVVYMIAVEEGLLPHERSREHHEQLEEERRLMFVGITRAQQELQLSLARYRDFRGQRKLTIPSSFLMELPRAEMELGCTEDTRQSWHETESVGFYGDADDEGGQVAPPPRTIRLTTAAVLANGGAPISPVETDVFRQGMWVLHASYGLGQIVALSGGAARRKATVEFRPPVGRKTLPLAEGSLQPVGA